MHAPKTLARDRWRWLAAVMVLCLCAVISEDVPTRADHAVGQLSGTAKWDLELVREFIQKKMEVNIEPNPKPFANSNVLDDVCQEFATADEAENGLTSVAVRCSITQ